MYRSRNSLLKIAVAVFSTVVCLPGYCAQLGESLDVVAATHESAVESQSTIDTLSRDTQVLLEEYRALRDNADYQAAYTRELEQLDATQQLQIESLHHILP